MNPIEAVARGAKSALTGVTSSPQQAAAQDARGTELVKKLALGGLALGTGTGAVVSLINYLKSMKEEAEAEDESRLNDDTLYIPAIGKSAAEAEKSGGDVNRWLAPGLAMTGGILTAGGSYALTQSVYNYLQKKRRQRMLDEAQGEAMLAAEDEREQVMKNASEASPARMTFYDLATAFPVAIPLLAALASGGVAYTALQKTFPTVKAPRSPFPKRVRQVSATGEVSELPEEDDSVKSAAEIAALTDLDDAAHEFLILTVDQAAREKSAGICLTSDILNRVAKDGLRELVEMQKTAGLDGLVEAVKGASDRPADLPDRVLAAAAICKSARLRPVVAALAAAELQELAPGMYASAMALGPEVLEKFAGLAPLMHVACFRPLMLEKSAAENPLLGELSQLIQPALGLTDDDADVLTSDANGSGMEDAEGDDVHGDDELQAANLADPVDDLMHGQSKKSPILDPVEDDTEELPAAPAV